MRLKRLNCHLKSKMKAVEMSVDVYVLKLVVLLLEQDESSGTVS